MKKTILIVLMTMTFPKMNSEMFRVNFFFVIIFNSLLISFSISSVCFFISFEFPLITMHSKCALSNTTGCSNFENSLSHFCSNMVL